MPRSQIRHLIQSVPPGLRRYIDGSAQLERRCCRDDVVWGHKEKKSPFAGKKRERETHRHPPPASSACRARRATRPPPRPPQPTTNGSTKSSSRVLSRESPAPGDTKIRS